MKKNDNKKWMILKKFDADDNNVKINKNIWQTKDKIRMFDKITKKNWIRLNKTKKNKIE